ncbi:AT-hook DNA-binding family protein [Theobroma cacao]|uniref:AT-hook DNA-binding family protein n=1 Tax=Theobroma cacao TaxID=3641 RepID=A0A061GSR7_THECC|nr:AT-hook DNA-binding family protein [Theobroma cacao]
MGLGQHTFHRVDSPFFHLLRPQSSSYQNQCTPHSLGTVDPLYFVGLEFDEGPTHGALTSLTIYINKNPNKALLSPFITIILSFSLPPSPPPPMADYSGAISLSQAHTSEDDSSEHSPRSVPTLSTAASGGGGGSSKSKTPSNKIITLDHHHHHHHHHQTPSSSENTARKPRGRPPGSKNKPKPPIVITRDCDSAMKPVILEISAGSDIIDSIINFARRNHVGVSIISATGSVSNVTLRHPVSHAPALSLHGPFGLLSLCGSFIGSSTVSSSNKAPQSSSSSTSPSPSSLSSPLSCSFGVTLAGAQGQVFGGIVGGKVMAATQVIVVAATFINPALHRLPCEGDNEDRHQETKPGVHSNVGGGGGATAAAVGATESCSSAGMSMSVYGVASPSPLSCQISPDVMPWGPSSRPY